MKEKLTPWFPVRVKPAHPGPYEAQHSDSGSLIYMHNWNGRFWGMFAFDPTTAAINGIAQTGCDIARWRGLAKNPARKA